jgi:hypothetical protein
MIRVLVVAALFACGGSQPKPAPAPPPPPPADAAGAQPASGSGSAAVEIPAECTAYIAALEKLEGCTKLPPQSRDAMKGAVEQLKSQLPGAVAGGSDARAQVIQACQQGGDAVTQAAKGAGC